MVDLKISSSTVVLHSYEHNNCAALKGATPQDPIIDPQNLIAVYLTHDEAVGLSKPYANSQALAQQANKPLIMFETNTASCGGFAGISDSYGAALWALDYGFQMAYYNFTHGLLHVGGQNTYYNVCNSFKLPLPKLTIIRLAIHRPTH